MMSIVGEGGQIEDTTPFHKSLLLGKNKKNIILNTAHILVCIYACIVYTCKISVRLYNIDNKC